LPSAADRSSATDQLMSDNLISKKQVNQIGILEPGQFIVCPSGKHAYFQYFFLPKSRFWEEGNGNFYRTVWKNTVDKWIDVKSEIDNIKSQRKIEEVEVKAKKQKAKENKEEFLAEKATLAELEKDLEEVKENKAAVTVPTVVPKIEVDKIANSNVNKSVKPVVKSAVKSAVKPIVINKKPAKILSKKAYKKLHKDKFDDSDII